jgi:Tol biopolymer transport system component
MSFGIKKLYLGVMAVLLNQVCFSAEVAKAGKSPLDELPAYIKQVTYFGERADWSQDGKNILFLSKTFGDVYEVELATGKIRLVTGHYYHEGYTRALYLSNGDILLSGARKFDASNPQASRSGKNAELWVLKKDLSSPPTPLGEHCSEGPAVSRKRMTIAWTLQDEGLIYIGDIVYENEKPELINKKLILDANNLPFKCNVETQNFRPPDEKELIFSAYMERYRYSDVAGLNLETGKIINYTNSPKVYDEPEGIFPDGKYTLVECDRHSQKGTQYIDIYKLTLDGSGQMERLTHFADYPGYKASNPVVSDDSGFIAFQYAKMGDQAGVGRGILVFDIAGYEKAKP